MGTDWVNKGAMTATVVVAAVDSLNKGAANYICDGTNDELEIMAANNAANGGNVILLEGTYSIDADCTIDNCTIIGQGEGTLLNITTNTNSILVHDGGRLWNLRVRTPEDFTGNAVVVEALNSEWKKGHMIVDNLIIETDNVAEVDTGSVGLLIQAIATSSDACIQITSFGYVTVRSSTDNGAFQTGVLIYDNQTDPHDSWINGNYFQGFMLDHCKVSLHLNTTGATDAKHTMSGNIIKSVTVQAHPGFCTDGILLEDDHSGNNVRTQFPSCDFHDFPGGSDTIHIAAGARFTFLIGGFEDLINDLGDRTVIIEQEFGGFYIPQYTTAEIAALTAREGMLIFNSTLNRFVSYEHSAWSGEKELFIPAVMGYLPGTSAKANDSYYGLVIFPDNDDCYCYLSEKIPVDFISFVSLKAVWWSVAAAGNMYWRMYLDFGASGQNRTTHQDGSGFGTTATAGANLINVQETAHPIDGSAIAVGDYIGVTVRRGGGDGDDTLGQDVFLVGVLLTYIGRGV